MRLVERLLLAPWRAIAADAAIERRATGFDEKLDPRVPATLILVALVLVGEEYVGDRDFFARLFSSRSREPYYDLWSFAWWSGSKLIGYVIVPLAAMTAFRVPLSTANLGVRGTAKHLGAYALLFAVVLPIVLVASRTTMFQQTYPFYRQAALSGRDLVAWELLYALSFVALELFYRGFVVGMLRRSLGPYAIFVMIVPYAMIHFGKPAAEATGAIFAGIALGTLAMATRSIWGGVLIHVAIAWTMDLAALLATTGLPTRWSR